MAALKTVSQLKDSVAGILSGMDLSNVDNLDGALERAARTLVQKADVPEACVTQNLTLYSGVTDYLCDDRIFGTAINDIRPQGISRNPWDFVVKRPGSQFDRTKGFLSNGTMATFEYVSGVPIIRIVSKIPQERLIIDPMTSIDDWVAADSASGLANDTTVFYQSPASMRFTLTGSAVGTLTKTLPNAIDASAYEGIGTAFLAIRIPDGATASDLTDIKVRLGSDSSNYAEVSEGMGFLGAFVSGEWLLVAFDYSIATNTGTPDWSEIDYVQVRLSHSSTIVNFRLGGLWISLPSPVQVLSQSAAIFKDGTLPTSTEIVSNNDTIILSNPAYTLYEFESALSVLQQTGAGASDATSIKISQILEGNGGTDIGLYARYRGDNPSQELRTVGSWYDDRGSAGSRGRL